MQKRRGCDWFALSCEPWEKEKKKKLIKMVAPGEHVMPDPNHTDLDVGTSWIIEGRFVYVNRQQRGLPALTWRIRTSKMRPILPCFCAQETTDDRFNPRGVDGGGITSYISWDWRKIDRGGVWVDKYVCIIAGILLDCIVYLIICLFLIVLVQKLQS